MYKNSEVSQHILRVCFQEIALMNNFKIYNMTTGRHDTEQEHSQALLSF